MEKSNELTQAQRDLLSAAEERALRRLPIWAWYIKGARDMLVKLRDCTLCEEPHAGDTGRVTAETKIYNKALLDLILSSKDNTVHFLMEDYGVRYAEHERDKKGKLKKCRAFFARRIVKYEEV